MSSSRALRPPLPVDLRQTLGPLRVGANDPAMRLGAGAASRAFHTPAGPVTLRLETVGDRIDATSWGPGSDWALEQAPHVVGCHDDLADFAPEDRFVARALRRRPGLRIGASGLVADILVPTILAQKVTGLQAVRAWTRMVRWWGEPAPGPEGLTLPPSPARFAAAPYQDFHSAGVERTRAETIRRACARIDRLQEAVTMPRADAERRLTALPGLGRWTSGIVMRVAMGDADAVEVGDYHLPNMVAWNLAGEARADDARMLELLAPFAGHRGRVIRLIESVGQHAPRYGRRLAPHLVENL